MKKRILSAMIVFVMVLGMVPAELIPIMAKTVTESGDVYYSREIPEIAILNKYTGEVDKTDGKFYNKLKGDLEKSEKNETVALYPQYNAMRTLYGKEWTYTADFKNVSDMSYSVPWSASVAYKDSTIKKLIQKSGNIKWGVSTQFNNYQHEHHWGTFGLKGAEVNTGLSMVMNMGGYSSYTLNGHYSLDNRTYTYSGWNQYMPLNYGNDDNGGITFSRNTIEINGTDPCKCVGATASQFLITLRDEKGPQIVGLQYSTDNGENWRTPYGTVYKTRAKAGGELLIKITYDEPIRFADDSASGKEKLYLGLERDGKSVDINHRAYLYKLDGNSVYYKYTVPSDDKLSEDLKVTKLSQKILFGKSDDEESQKTIDLVQVCANTKNSKFKIAEKDVPSGYSNKGFTTSESYITDLAGNPIEDIELSAGELYIDTVAPSVAQVRFDAALNNEDVKQAKADYTPETLNEGDQSDNYLGAGDRLNITVIMAEALETVSNGSWNYAVAKTNIVAPEGYTPPQGVFVDSKNIVHVTSRYFTPPQPGVYTIYPTEFVMYGFEIVEGMTVKEDSNNKNKEIRVEKFYFQGYSGEIKDLAGNSADKDDVKINLGANKNALFLDTTPPTVTGGTYVALDNGFSFPVTIDGGTGTLTEGTYGKFMLSQEGDGRSYQFQWVAKAKNSLSDVKEEDWKIGSTGNEYSFYQNKTTYFFIREYGSDYETLDKCTFTVKAKDYAGNVGTLNADSSVIKWYVDKKAPNIDLGEMKRELNGDKASVSVKVVLTDSHDISQWKYAWTDNGTTPPTTWKDGALEPNVKSPVTVTAIAEFDAGNNFDKYLWVQAADNSNEQNTSVICLGKYNYDLSKINYGMTYNKAIETYAKLSVDSLGENDALVFLRTLNADENKYAVQVFKNGDTAENIFAEGDWAQYRVTLGDDEYYHFTRYASSDVTSSITNGRYYGDMDITVIKIKSAGIQYLNDLDTILTQVGEGKDGTKYPYTTENIRLRAASTTPWINYSDFESPELVSPDYISISSDDDLYSKNESAEWTKQILPTLAGVSFKINVEKDKNGWECADIETSKSKLVFKSRTDGHEVENPLGSFTSDGKGGFTQTVVAKGEYTTGLYDVFLRLVLVTGDEYEFNYQYTQNSGGIAVDATKPNASLKISKFTYDHYSLFWQNTLNIDESIYPERNFANDDTIYLPVSGGYFDREVLGKGAPDDIYDITFESEGEPERGELKDGDRLRSYTGQYYVEVWTKDNPDKKVKFYSKEQNQTSVKGDGRHGFTTIEAQKDNENYVFLNKDENNVVYARKVYSNGGKSDTITLKIWPVTDHITGNMSVDKDTMQLVFTPTSAPETYKDGARVYAYAYQNGEDFRGDKCTGKLIEMDVSPSGGWACPLLPEGAIYRVFTINSYGSVWAGDENEYVYQRAPWISPAIDNGDNTGFLDNGDGTYKWIVHVDDDKNCISDEGIDLHISFNPEYFVEGYDLHLDKSDFDEYGFYRWNSTGRSATGIYNIKASLGTENDEDAEYIRLEIDGVIRRQEQEVQTEQTMNISIAATDNFGYTTIYSTGDKNVIYKKPEILSDTLSKDGLRLEFNQAIFPTESWAWHEGDKKHSWLPDPGYSKTWEGAFPIVANGTYTIEYYDIFGNLCASELTTNAFTDEEGYDWSIDITFSETEVTKNDVFVTACLKSDRKKEGTGLMFSWSEGKETIIVPVGKYDSTYRRPGFNQFDPTKDWSTDNKLATSSPRKVRIGYNTYVQMSAQDTDCIGETLSYNAVFTQRVHIDNIQNGPTEAKLRWYFSEIGTDMSQSEIEQYVEDHGGQVELEGTAQVWYKTTRRVTPVDGSQTEFLFTTENQDETYTFKFKNEMGYETELDVSLPEGIKLVEPEIPYVDLKAPTVNVAISSKRTGKYVSGESFLAEEAEDDIKKKFDKTGIAQGYCLSVNASDESGFEISINDGGKAPSGISILGNQVFVDKAQSFEITVRDKSPKKNKTTVTLTKDMFENIDTTAPTVSFTQKQVDRYTIEITAVLSDLDDEGRTTTTGGGDDTITLVSPQGAKRTAPYTYVYNASSNGNVEFEFYDMVGNRSDKAKSTFTISGIDSAPPELKLTWTPPRTEENLETGEKIVDYSMPTTDHVNTNVTAVIDSDKPIYDLSLHMGDMEIKLLEAGRPTGNNPFAIGGMDNEGNEYDSVVFSATPSRITATFMDSMGFSDMYFVATAANNKSTRIDLDGFVNVDKIAPNVKLEDDGYEYLYYEKEPGVNYTVPYAVKVTLAPDELAISQNYGEIESGKWGTTYKYYIMHEPLVLTFKENGTYNVNFMDLAGNTTIVPVVINTLDRTAPVLNVDNRQESGQSTSIDVTVNEVCTLSYGTVSVNFAAGEKKTITFTDNGTYILTATDNAGNKSEKAVVVGNIDKIMPQINFAPTTVYILQNSEDAALDSLLDSGYTAWDDKSSASEITVAIDKTEVKLDTAGVYNVKYTVTDKAGNALLAERFVQVVGEDTVCVKIDDQIVLPGETAAIDPGAHKLSLTNCDEPFTVKAKMGINWEGQMKYSAASSIAFAEDGSFTVNGKTYYTLLVTTQSRKTIRILLCVGL